jgi:AraC-like DNA-binding protein
MSDFQSLDKFFGNTALPFPAENIADHFELYMNNDICVCINKGPIVFNEDQIGHHHSSYEFIIPSNPMTCIGIGKNTLGAGTGSLIPINTWQTHGPKINMSIDKLLAVHVDKNFLNGISHQATSSSDFYFENTALPCVNEIKNLIEHFMREAKYKQVGYKFILDSLSTQMTVSLLRDAKFNAGKNIQKTKTHDCKSINRVIEFFREHYSNSDYSSEEVAKLANLSTYHFIRVFKQQTGRTPYDYLIDIKIERAKEMLKNKNYSIIDICFSCGFTNHSHFTTTFKKRMGVTPTEYRMEYL